MSGQPPEETEPMMAEIVLPPLETQGLDDTQAWVAVEESQVPETEVPPGQTLPDAEEETQNTSVVPANSGEEEIPLSADCEEVLAWDAKCKKCCQPITPQEAVVKALKVLWCQRMQHTLHHGETPPGMATAMLQRTEQAFWAKCKDEKDENGFSYQRVRDLLVRQTTESKMQQRRLDVGCL